MKKINFSRTYQCFCFLRVLKKNLVFLKFCSLIILNEAVWGQTLNGNIIYGKIKRKGQKKVEKDLLKV